MPVNPSPRTPSPRRGGGIGPPRRARDAATPPPYEGGGVGEGDFEPHGRAGAAYPSSAGSPRPRDPLDFSHGDTENTEGEAEGWWLVVGSWRGPRLLSAPCSPLSAPAPCSLLFFIRVLPCFSVFFHFIRAYPRASAFVRGFIPGDQPGRPYHSPTFFRVYPCFSVVFSFYPRLSACIRGFIPLGQLGQHATPRPQKRKVRTNGSSWPRVSASTSTYGSMPEPRSFSLSSEST